MALSIHSVRAEPSVPVSGVQIAASLVVRQAGSQQNLSDEELTAALEGASSQRYQLRFRWYRVSAGPAQHAASCQTTVQSGILHSDRQGRSGVAACKPCRHDLHQAYAGCQQPGQLTLLDMAAALTVAGLPAAGHLTCSPGVLVPPRQGRPHTVHPVPQGALRHPQKLPLQQRVLQAALADAQGAPRGQATQR